MKKILIFITVFVMLFVVVVIPASAYIASDSYDYNGIVLADIRHLSANSGIYNNSFYWLLVKVNSTKYDLLVSQYPFEYNSTSDKVFNNLPDSVTDYTLHRSVRLYNDSDGKFIYTYNDVSAQNGDWDVSSQSSYVMWSSHDVYYSGTNQVFLEGDVNFFRPLHQVVEEVMKGEMTQRTLPSLVGVMKVIALCGVGCLACLISLRLFGRVFRVFHLKS